MRVYCYFIGTFYLVNIKVVVNKNVCLKDIGFLWKLMIIEIGRYYVKRESNKKIKIHFFEGGNSPSVFSRLR